MARARNIKPGFFENEDLADCGAYGMLLFAGLWTLSDREGRLEDRPKRIRAKVFPYFDDVDVDDVLAQLEKHRFIERYCVAGSAYIQIVNFSKHQMPHYKEALSVIPPPEGHPQPVVVATGPTREVRQGILERDGKCIECGATEDLTLDHIIPRSKGGTDDEDNLQTLCRRCNSAKNNREARSMVGQSSDNQSGALASDTGYRIPDSLIADTGLLEDDAPAAPVPLPKYSQVFEVFWREYPTGHGSKVKTYAAWKAAGLDKSGTADERNAVMAGLQAWKACERWAVKGMVKSADIWVKERWWDDPPPPPDVPANGRASPTNARVTTTDLILAATQQVKERHEQGRSISNDIALGRGIRAENEISGARTDPRHRGLDDGTGGHTLDAVWRDRR